MSRPRIAGFALTALLAAAGWTGGVPDVASAECSSPDQWPLFREGAPSASVVVAGTVRDVFHGRSPEHVDWFRLDVDDVLRGTARDSLPFPGITTERGCIGWGLQVKDGDRIVVALGPARTGIPGYVASVAFLSPITRGGYTPGVERLTMRHVRQILDLPSADLVFFTADDGRHGRELWRTDGRGRETQLVKDIRPDGAADPQDLAAANGRLWFSADDGIHGRELWVSDGTVEGTHLAMDIRPGPASSNPRWITEFYGGDAWFSADDGIHGRELWVWEASRGRARMLLDVRANRGPRPGSDPRGLIESNGSVVFSADDGVHGRELWSLEAYADEGAVLTDLRPGPAGSAPAELIEVGARYDERVMLSADDGLHGRELFSADNGGTHPSLAADLLPGTTGSAPRALTGAAAQLWFVAGDGHGDQVWGQRSHRAPVALTSLAPSTAGSPSSVAAIALLSRALAVFGATSGDDGGQLWVSDGTPEGTRLLTQVPGGLGPGGAMGTKGRAFFTTHGPGAAGAELWITDGTAVGTRALADIRPDGDAHPHALVGYHGDLVFAADDGRTGQEPWFSSGRPGGTRRILDIRPGPLGSDPRDLTPLIFRREAFDRLRPD